MNLFINDIPICIVSTNKLGRLHGYSLVINSKESINSKLMVDNVLLKNPTNRSIDKLLDLMTNNDLERVSMITVVTDSKKKIIEYIKSKYKLIEAGGGIVEKNGEFLMIYRKGLWDIPKGKMEMGETPKKCAKREVEEETYVKVKVGEKIGAIWHTYTNRKNRILKKTHWYAMTCMDDREMKPQMTENITKVQWMNMQEMQEALADSYRSLRFLVQNYRHEQDKS